MSDKRTHRGESTESLHREIQGVTQPDTSAGVEDRIAKTQELPDHIGPFKILEILGEGGMGVVYLAEQAEPIRRRVALKLIKLGMDTKQVIARFEAERQALALMNHPNVAKVFDAGATPDGRPYFVMEHVPGVPVTDYCDQHRLNTTERLQLFDQVCHAVQHAHQKGIIHRDIKPSNVLVTVATEGRSDVATKGRRGGATKGRSGAGPSAATAGAVVKVIDFGVAKATQQRLTEKTLFTEQGQLIGTPEYMSPEQAEMTALDIDTRTDIYSLGVLLYELLTGALPFDPQSLRRAGFAEIQRIIREVDPPKPSTRVSSLGAVEESRAGTQPSQSVPRPSGSGPGSAQRPDGPLPHGRGAEQSEPGAQATGSEPRASARANVPISEGTAPVDGARGVLDYGRFAQAEACGSGLGSALDIARHRRTDPSALVKQLRGDLDWITMKALDKDRTRRYATASELGEDIQRHLAGNPVVAAPPSAVYRLRKLIKRRRGMFATVSVLTLAITGGLVVSTVFYIRADRERQTAEAVAGFFGEMLASVNPQIGSKDVDVREVLDRSAARIDDQFPERPLVRAFLQDIISRSYGGLGLPQVALQHAQSAVAIRERELGESHPDTLHSMDNLGYLYNGTGDLERSEEICAKPLAVRQDRLGDDHPDTLLSHYHHGLNLFAHHQYREAARVQRMVWEGQRRALGGEHPNT